MYDELTDVVEKQNYKNAGAQGPNLKLLEKLPDYERLKDYENSLDICFKNVFHEPLGYYLMKCFLISDYSVDKAVFVSDVELYKTLRDPSARLKVAKLIFERFCADEGPDPARGQSVFDRNPSRKRKLPPSKHNIDPEMAQARKDEELRFSMGTTNACGVYGKAIQDVESQLTKRMAPKNLFEPVCQAVLDDLRMDVFPRFLKHPSLYKRYIQCKSIESEPVDKSSFAELRVLGRGAFGFVNAVIKKDSGQLYAMKCINKKRVMATKSQKTIMYERNFLACMSSNFVTCLKYAVMDEESLYFVLDLMVGGDLKYHLNKSRRFKEDRARFCAAEVLLGLEHIHSKNIIYRDMKLENILLDEKGHCRISDFGLSVQTKDRVKGYAGTPGYVAPEVILKQPYDKMADYFAYGVMVYRFLSGKKPFEKKKSRRRDNKKKKGGRGRTSELDKNVVEMEPEYPEQYFTPIAKSFLKSLMMKDPKRRLGFNGIKEIKQHQWFDPVDFGLLEAGYLDPPFVPDMAAINAESRSRVGPPPGDEKYAKVKLTKEFEESLSGFPYMSTEAQQQEIVEVLKRSDEGINWEKFAPLQQKVPRAQRERESASSSKKSGKAPSPRGGGKKSKCSIM